MKYRVFQDHHPGSDGHAVPISSITTPSNSSTAKTAPDFAYTFEEAVNNVPPYLCNFQVMKVQTKFQMEGISKRTISLEDQKKLILQGKEVEEINFEGSQLEKQVINKGTNTLIVREFMEEASRTPTAYCPARPSSFAQPRPTPGASKKSSTSSTRSITENWPRSWCRTIRACTEREAC